MTTLKGSIEVTIKASIEEMVDFYKTGMEQGILDREDIRRLLEKKKDQEAGEIQIYGQVLKKLYVKDIPIETYLDNEADG